MASRSRWRIDSRAAALALAALLAGCHGPATAGKKPAPRPATATAPEARPDDEIIVAGQRVHTGTRVVTWLEPGGYNAYTNPKGYAARVLPGPARPGHAPTRAELQRTIDQFVLHYDDCGLSRRCFEVLQQRNLSVHFLLDVDGTIYQTLDLRERAAHATVANDRSIGVEIANIGAFPPAEARKVFAEWYERTQAGQVRLRFPPSAGPPKILTPGFAGRPERPEPVRGTVQGKSLEQYDFTPEQYAALIKLTAALCRTFPRITCDCPRDTAGRPLGHRLPEAALADFHGVLGHCHIQANKVDPGPALQWDAVLNGARRLNP
ncbi:MAG TPA: N-acetylmuramoyl-L-alanine amidase [Lacunisphaera sp.]|nr:N-acetylmuramoyl-L-alanine amidase [Lacunisphaera sp.]